MTAELLILGKSGQVARELARAVPGARCAGREEADFARPGSVVDLIENLKPSAVINAAAWTAVDAAEENRDAAFAINATAPAAIAEICARHTIPLVHISTDYVFDGSGDTPWPVDAPTAPLGVYGASKLAGEDAVRAAGGTHAILRTSWVFSAHGGNFVKTMLRLAETRDRLTIVADQIGGPTPAAAIAGACLSMAGQLADDASKTGTYHFSGAPDVSWADFAREIFARSGATVDVEDIPSSAYPTPASRPANSRLDCSATADMFGIARPDWRTGLVDVLKTLGS